MREPLSYHLDEMNRLRRHHSIGSDAGVIRDDHGTNHASATSDRYVISDRRAFITRKAGSDGDTMIKDTVFSNGDPCVDKDSPAVKNPETAADLSRRGDVRVCKELEEFFPQNTEHLHVIAGLPPGAGDAMFHDKEQGNIDHSHQALVKFGRLFKDRSNVLA